MKRVETPTSPTPVSPTAVDRIRILVICTGNSARSQITEAWFRHLGGQRLEVASAGTHPVDVHPQVPKVMTEVGVSTTGLRSKAITGFVEQSFDLVITVCDRAAASCPVFPGAGSTLHWPFADPVAADPEDQTAAFRDARDRIGDRVRGWLTKNQIPS